MISVILTVVAQAGIVAFVAASTIPGAPGFLLERCLLPWKASRLDGRLRPVGKHPPVRFFEL